MKEFEQRAYITPDGKAEWVWARAHDFCQMAQDAWRFLGKKGRIDAISKHLESLQVDTAEVHYRPRASRDQSTWQHHSLESRAFLAILLYMCKSKASKTKTKQCAWKLLIGMVKLAFDSLGQAQRFTGVVYGQAVLVEAQKSPRQAGLQLGRQWRMSCP